MILKFYDYLLGGNYNYEVDKKVADKILKELPLAGSLARMVRWFLGNAIEVKAYE